MGATLLIVKRRKKNEFTWKTIFVKDINSISDFKINGIDKTARSGYVYQYAAVPVINGEEGNYSSVDVLSEFDKIFIIGKDKTIGTELGDANINTTRNIPSSVNVLLNSKYDGTSNTLNINCGDYMTYLDGSKNGKIGGALNIIFYAYDELFLSSWIEEAKSDGVDTTKYLKLFEWAAINHPNIITKTTDNNLKLAVYSLITKNKLTETQQNDYLNIINSAYPKQVTFKNEDGAKILIAYNVIRDTVINFLKEFTNV